MDGTTLSSGRDYLVWWTGLPCQVDGATLSGGRGYLVRWAGLSCQVDGTLSVEVGDDEIRVTFVNKEKEQPEEPKYGSVLGPKMFLGCKPISHTPKPYQAGFYIPLSHTSLDSIYP